MFEIKSETTRYGKTRYDISLDNGECFTGYQNTTSVVVKQGQVYFCSIPTDDLEKIFENVNLLANNNGDYHSYLRGFYQRGTQSVKSRDGKFNFGYSVGKDGRHYVYAYSYVEDRQRTIYSNIGDVDKAKQCIKDTCREYDETGKFKVYRNNICGVPFKEEYLNKSGIGDIEVPVHVKGVSVELESFFISEIKDLKSKNEKLVEALSLKNIEIENLKDRVNKKLPVKSLYDRLKCPDCGEKRIIMTANDGRLFLGCCSGEHHKTYRFDELAQALYELGCLETWNEYHGLTEDAKILVRS